MLDNFSMILWIACNMLLGYYKYERVSNSDIDIGCVWVPCPRNGKYRSHIGVLLEWNPRTTYKLSNWIQSVPISVHLLVAYRYFYLRVYLNAWK